MGDAARHLWWGEAPARLKPLNKALGLVWPRSSPSPKRRRAGRLVLFFAQYGTAN